MAYRLGVDVGGTFTDLLLVDEKSGASWSAKVPSTPADQSVGVLNGNVLLSIVSVILMMAVAAVTAMIVNVLVERIAYRPLRNAPRLVPLISALGASFFLQYTMRGLFGDGVYNYPTIEVFEQRVDIFGLGFLRLKWLDVLVVTAAIVMMVALYLFVQRTKAGTAIRAVSEDKATAALMGINVNRAIVMTLVLGAALWIVLTLATDRPVAYDDIVEQFKYGSIGSEPGVSLLRPVGGALPPYAAGM